MKSRIILTAALLGLLSFSACNNEAPKTAEDQDTTGPKFVFQEENVAYNDGDVKLNSFVVFDKNKEGKRPAVLVIPEWWGLDDYIRSRARQLAGLGYIAIAVDMYGDGKYADNPDSAKKFAGPFYADPQLAKRRFDAALAKLKSYAQTDSSKIGAMGYCFGGAQVLNMARLGEDLKAVVSFHGNLVGVPADKSKLKADVLICHGGADPFVPQAEVDQFKKQMDSIGARYTLKVYEGATHAFTNPEATAKGKKFNMPISYNPAADTSSWKDMRDFFGKAFN